MAQFNITKLVDNRIFVEGTDFLGTHGKAILDSTEWDGIKSHAEFKTATADFDAAVEAFFAPLTEAAEKLDATVNTERPSDPVTYVVLEEEQEGKRFQPGHLVKLSKDSIVLRLIEAEQYDRLVWVGDQLEVVEADTPLPVVEPTPEVPAEQA